MKHLRTILLVLITIANLYNLQAQSVEYFLKALFIVKKQSIQNGKQKVMANIM